MTVAVYRNILSKCKQFGAGGGHHYSSYRVFLCASSPHAEVEDNSRALCTSAAPPPQTVPLPSLPVPPLTPTIEKFLKFAEPVQSAHEFGETINLANRFLESTEATELQRLLEERARKLDNWLTPWWLHFAYLAARTPLPVVTSPGITFPRFDFAKPGIDAQLECAAKIIHAALKYHHIIISDELPVERGPGGVPFDMSQYKLMYGTTRIPGHGTDTIRYGKDRTEWARHILVTRDGRTFCVPVYDAVAGTPLAVDQLVAQLRMVVQQTDEQPERKSSINIVSSDDREVWAAVYSRIRERNPEELRLIEDALFVMSLDRHFGADESATNDGNDLVPPRPMPPADQNMAMALHGGGTRQNAANRWFDKTLQFHVNEHGYGGLTYEHTPAEGPPLSMLLDFVCAQFDTNSFDNFAVPSTAPSGATIAADGQCLVKPPRELHFLLDQSDEASIRRSSDRLDNVVRNLEIRSLQFDHYGKDVPKQVAFQLAFFRLHGVHAPTYETGSLRMFADGRTDTVRLPSLASKRFVETIVKTPMSMLTARLMEVAITEHKRYASEVMKGMGMDRHLLGLRLLAAEHGISLPALLQSDIYKRLMHFRLSTSQVPTAHVLPMGFGPSAPDCYGVCYNPQQSRLFFTITAFNDCTETSAENFAKALERALLDMRDLADRAGRLKKPRAKL